MAAPACYSITMKVRSFLSGVLVGSGLMLVGLSQHHSKQLDKLTAEYEQYTIALRDEQQAQLKEAWGYADEECPELLEDYLQLEDQNLELKQALLEATIKCEWMIRDAHEEICK